jgi:hypothetical protein
MIYFVLNFGRTDGGSGVTNLIPTWYKQLSTNKSIEIQLYKCDKMASIFEIEMDTYITGKDHGGIKFSVGLFHFNFSFNFYDHRHWDYENKHWVE